MTRSGSTVILLCVPKHKEITHEQTLIHSRCLRRCVCGRCRFGFGGHAAWPSAAASASPSAFNRMSALPRYGPCASQLARLHEALPRMQRLRAQAAAPSASEAYATSASEAYAEACAAWTWWTSAWWARRASRRKAGCAWPSLMFAGEAGI